jgi:hypothetical protein
MIENSKVPPSFLISVRFLCVILIFFGYCFNFMQKIDMSIAIVCMTNHTAIKMLQQTNKTNSFILISNYTNNNSYHQNNDLSCLQVISSSSSHKYVCVSIYI